MKKKEKSIKKEKNTAFYRNQEKVFYEIMNNNQKRIVFIRNGITKKQIYFISYELDIPLNQLANFIDVNIRTIQHKKDDDRLKSGPTEHSIMLMELYEKGKDVFGNKDLFNEWLKTENVFFNKEEPFSYLDTYYGINLIMNELGRIEHGMFS